MEHPISPKKGIRISNSNETNQPYITQRGLISDSRDQIIVETFVAGNTETEDSMLIEASRR